MNTSLTQAQVMNSLQIAELVQSRHDSVKRTIERLADQEIIRLPPLVVVEKINNLGLKTGIEVYLFSGEQGKLDSITVVAQLSPRFTAAIVKRWQELERSNFPASTHNQLQALQAAYLRQRPDMQRLLKYRRLGLSRSECARLLSRHPRTITRHLRTLESMGFLPAAKMQQANLPLFTEVQP